MRPHRSFLFLLIFLVCFTGLWYILPPSVKIPSPAGILPATLREMISPEGNTVKADSLPSSDYRPAVVPDTIIRSDTIAYIDGHGSFIPLRSFIDSLYFSRGQLRVLYYGDSQIEGDRVSSYLRQWLRQGREGSGPGLFLPLMTVMYTGSVNIRSSLNWERYNYLSYQQGVINHSNLGPFMAFCRYLPEGVTSGSPVKATVRISPSRLADKKSAQYDILRIFYGNLSGEVQVTVKAGNFSLVSDTLEKSIEPGEFSCPLLGEKNITIEFEGRVSPDIYGISIESRKGVIVDNIPQRGSAGLEFTMVDPEHLKSVLDLLSPDLFILHYGLNIVKNIRSEYNYYSLGLERQINLIKNVCPDAQILVVGVTDMATAEGDSLRSYPNLPAIINAQRNAASRTGVTFWDSYQAMGGYNSIIRWAGNNPPLARPDYVHFTNLGADSLSKILIADMFRQQDIVTLIKSDTLIVADTVMISASLLQPADSAFSGEEAEVGSRPASGLPAVLLGELFRYDPDEPMIFSSPAFWIFLLIVLAGYSLIFNKPFIRNLYLLLVSLFFYYKSGGFFIILLLLVTIVDYSCGLMIYRSESRPGRRFFLILSLVSNLLLLSYFKYTAFFTDLVNSVFGTGFVVHDYLAAFSNNHLGTSLDVSSIILPVGISFFTFQSLSYTIDVYRSKVAPVRNIADFGFYVSFFPQLVAGPIVRASEFIPQIYEKFRLNQREFSHALYLILKGLVKKIVISDFIAVGFIDRVFETPAIYSGFENLMAVYGYGLQIYCDFSGYTDIAIGIGLILGFRLPVNFNSPYKASDVSEFWKRWHISLSRWLKDYLYIPLGGNRKGRIRTQMNLMITMLLGGLWHGADLRFILWGALHGVGLVFNKLWNRLSGSGRGSGLLRRALAVFLTFNFVNFCWIFFRSPDVHSAGIMLKQIFTAFVPGSYMALLTVYGTVFILILTGYFVHFLPEKVKEAYRGLFINMPLALQMVVALLAALLIFQMRSPDIVPFIYFRF
jgi:D-alanyl-lipoteichoic acid acyltransferase DltB (MBOAT superfamily)